METACFYGVVEDMELVSREGARWGRREGGRGKEFERKERKCMHTWMG